MLFRSFASLGVSTSVADGALKDGRITGELRYPSCNKTAPGLEVCAEAVGSRDTTACTSDFEATEAGELTYTLDVPAGRYLVFARTPIVRGGQYRAYFSQAVRCGLEVGCDDHAPIEIGVRPGQTVSGVHPSDWLRGTEPPKPQPLVN